MEIPIELFSMFIGLSIIMIAVSLFKNIPMVIITSGVIMLFLFSITDSISRGAIPNILTDSGSSTTVSWIEDSISFNTEIKIVFLVVSSLIVMIGGIMQYEKKELLSDKK